MAPLAEAAIEYSLSLTSDADLMPDEARATTTSAGLSIEPIQFMLLASNFTPGPPTA
jgi:hypothetical protein